MIIKMIVTLISMVGVSFITVSLMVRTLSLFLLFIEIFGFILFPIAVVAASITAQPMCMLLCMFIVLASASELVFSGILISKA